MRLDPEHNRPIKIAGLAEDRTLMLSEFCFGFVVWTGEEANDLLRF